MIQKMCFTSLVVFVLSIGGVNADDSIKQSAQEIKASVKKAARAIKGEAKRGAKEVKKGFKAAKQDLKEAL
jgi:hypothetical protein